MSCPLCAPPEPERLLFQNEAASVVIHEDWSMRGHAMVIARRHVENISQLQDVERHALLDVYVRAEKILLEATGADRAVLLKLGLQVPHLHLHIYPVRRDVDRAGVFDMIETRVRESMTPEEKSAFVADLRARFI